jgi:hypothetical protein
MLRLPVRQATKDWIRKPVASVPMSESIRNTTTTTPLSIPTANAAASAMRMPTQTGRSELTIA